MSSSEFLSRAGVFSPTPQTLGWVCNVICFGQWNMNQNQIRKQKLHYLTENLI